MVPTQNMLLFLFLYVGFIVIKYHRIEINEFKMLNIFKKYKFKNQCFKMHRDRSNQMFLILYNCHIDTK